VVPRYGRVDGTAVQSRVDKLGFLAVTDTAAASSLVVVSVVVRRMTVFLYGANKSR
jgi:hypothetical protein